MSVYANLSVYDYQRTKICDLYDSQNMMTGQAYSIQYKANIDGTKTLSFSIPYMNAGGDRNFRWQYLKSEYLIRMIYGDIQEWFVANQPTIRKSKSGIEGNVTCQSISALLKTKNIYMQFDDENGIGTINYLLGEVLKGTGWTLGFVDPQYEEDGVTEKIRTLSNGGKQGALGLVTTVCNIFKCRPVYDTEHMVLNVYSMKNREQVFELEVGRNVDSFSIAENSRDIITRLYVEGEYGDYGYVGIDDVNPTGLTYLLDFDYYRGLGMFTQAHEDALATYLEDIGEVNARIKANAVVITELADQLNELIGQCVLTVYYKSQGYVTPMFTYGNPTDRQRQMLPNDDVIILQNDGEFRYDTVVTTPEALVGETDYGIARFAIPASGQIGSKEVQIAAKEKEIENLQGKISRTTKQARIEEYEAEIAELEDEIEAIYDGTESEEEGEEDIPGLYAQMYEIMKADGLLYDYDVYVGFDIDLRAEQDDIESDFIIAMGNMLRDGYWSNQNYIVGQEAHLYADALDVMEHMSRPSVTFNVDYVRMKQDYDIPLEKIQLNAVARLLDDELELYENLFVSEISIGVDQENSGNLTVTNQDLTLATQSLGDLLSRMSQLADLIDQKNALYDRAKAIAKNGTLYTERLNGQIDVLKLQLMSTVSNWYTDDRGNLVFESADGGSAMMLSGAGFMLASGRTEEGDWDWRTKMCHWFSLQKCRIITN